MKQSQEEEVPWTKCTMHTSGDQCQFLSCRACRKCEPSHKHHEDPAENASIHVGTSFLIRPFGREWILATHPTSHCSPKLERVFNIASNHVDELDFQQVSPSLQFHAGVQCTEWKKILLARHPEIFSMSAADLVKFVRSKPGNKMVEIGLARLISQILRDRSGISDFIKTMTNITAYDEAQDTLAFKVLTARDPFGHTPEYVQVQIPATLVRTHVGHPIVFLQPQGYPSPAWISIKTTTKSDFTREAIFQALSHLRGRILSFASIASADMDFKEKMSLLQDFDIIGPQFLQNCMWVAQGSTRALQGFQHLPCHVRQSITKLSLINSSSIGTLENMTRNPSKFSKPAIQQFMQTILLFWEENIDAFGMNKQPPKSIYGKLMTDLKADMIHLLISLPKFDSNLMSNATRQEIQKRTYTQLNRVCFKIKYYNITQVTGVSGHNFNRYVTQSSNMANQSMPKLTDDRAPLVGRNTPHNQTLPPPKRLRVSAMAPNPNAIRPGTPLSDSSMGLSLQSVSEAASETERFKRKRSEEDEETDLGAQACAVPRKLVIPDIHMLDAYTGENKAYLGDDDQTLRYCSACQIPFPDLGTFNTHLRSCTRMKFCFYCKRLFQTPTTWAQHAFDCMNVDTWKTGDFCPHCPLRFQSVDLLQHHMCYSHPKHVDAKIFHTNSTFNLPTPEVAEDSLPDFGVENMDEGQLLPRMSSTMSKQEMVEMDVGRGLRGTPEFPNEVTRHNGIYPDMTGRFSKPPLPPPPHLSTHLGAVSKTLSRKATQAGGRQHHSGQANVHTIHDRRRGNDGQSQVNGNGTLLITNQYNPSLRLQRENPQAPAREEEVTVKKLSHHFKNNHLREEASIEHTPNKQDCLMAAEIRRLRSQIENMKMEAGGDRQQPQVRQPGTNAAQPSSKPTFSVPPPPISKSRDLKGIFATGANQTPLGNGNRFHRDAGHSAFITPKRDNTSGPQNNNEQQENIRQNSNRSQEQAQPFSKKDFLSSTIKEDPGDYESEIEQHQQLQMKEVAGWTCLLYTSPSPRDS